MKTPPGRAAFGVLFFGNHDGLVEAGFFRGKPCDLPAAVGGQQVCQLLPAGGAVLTGEFAHLQRGPVVDDILHQPVVLALPVPCLEGDTATGGGVVDIGRRVRTARKGRTVAMK